MFNNKNFVSETAFQYVSNRQSSVWFETGTKEFGERTTPIHNNTHFLLVSFDFRGGGRRGAKLFYRHEDFWTQTVLVMKSEQSIFSVCSVAKKIWLVSLFQSPPVLKLR